MMRMLLMATYLILSDHFKWCSNKMLYDIRSQFDDDISYFNIIPLIPVITNESGIRISQLFWVDCNLIALFFPQCTYFYVCRIITMLVFIDSDVEYCI